MTQDELFKQFLLFISTPSSNARFLVWHEVRIRTHAQPKFASGLLYAFVDGIDKISSDIDVDDVGRKLDVLADELFRHLKAELS
jgi:hypothetical protein